MTVPRRPARKPRVEDRIALWLTAYRAVLDEISRPSNPDNQSSERIAAAQVAAELVKGVENGDDAGSR